MKGGCVTDSPSNVGVPRLCVGVPLVVYSVALLNGGVWWVVCCPRVQIGSPSPSHCLVPFALLLLSSFLFSAVCVLCHGVVGLGLCLCDRVVSLWNSGDGCVG